MSFFLRSPDFSQGGRIPAQFTCQGSDISPELIWGDTPQSTKSFSLICDDPDAPMGTWVHWIIYNIPALYKGLKQNVKQSPTLADGIIQGRNDFNRIGYGGPAPPPGSIHRYYFRLYALDTMLASEPGLTKQRILSLMKNHIVAKTEYYGTFSR